MSIQDIFEGKKQWRVHMARVKALPQDYQIVYKEIQNYLFKIGLAENSDWVEIVSGIISLFEDGAASGKGVLEVTGQDVAAFCDSLLENSKADTKTYLDKVDSEVSTAIFEAMKKSAKNPKKE